MILPLKLTPDNTQLIGENVALGLPYALAAASIGRAYQTFNDWMKKGKNSKSGEYFQFYEHIEKCNVDVALKYLCRIQNLYPLCG